MNRERLFQLTMALALVACLIAACNIQEKGAAPVYTGSFQVDKSTGFVKVKDAGVEIGIWNSGGLNSRSEVVVSTADVTLTAQQSGALLTNKGDLGAQVVTLPAAAAGLNYCFFTYAAQQIAVDPATGDKIVVLTDAAGDKITNATAGNSICLVAVDATDWVAVAINGTWADGN